MQLIRKPYLVVLWGLGWLALTLPNLEGAVQIVPGTPSFVDLYIGGEVFLNGTGLGWDESTMSAVGIQWPGPTFPDDGSLIGSGELFDVDDFSLGKSLAKYEPKYNGLQTNLLMRARAEGISYSVTPGDDFFIAESNINGRLDMFLTSDNAVDRAGPYDITLDIMITGTDLSATTLAADAFMSYVVRITPDSGAPVMFSNMFSSLAPPPGGAPFVIQHSTNFLGVPLIPESHTFFADVEFGVGINDGLQTSVNGRTIPPDIYLSEANSLFDSTMALRFVAKPTVPEPNLLLGDANNDNQVTGEDLVIVQQNFGNVDPNTPTDGLFIGDANNDGQVTGADLIVVQQNFGNTLALVGAEVPEPTTACLLALAGLGAMARRRDERAATEERARRHQNDFLAL